MDMLASLINLFLRRKRHEDCGSTDALTTHQQCGQLYSPPLTRLTRLSHPTDSSHLLLFPLHPSPLLAVCVSAGCTQLVQAPSHLSPPLIMAFRLDNKVAVVTGGGSGIGKEITTLFAKQGAIVEILDVDVDTARLAAEEVSRSETARAHIAAQHIRHGCTPQVTTRTHGVPHRFQCSPCPLLFLTNFLSLFVLYVSLTVFDTSHFSHISPLNPPPYPPL